MSEPIASTLPPDEAIPRLVAEQGGRLHAVATRLCGSAEEARDLVQDVLLSAWRNWERFDGRSRPETWLYSIAARRCQRLHRRRSGEPRRIESLEELLPSPERGVPDVTAIQAGEGPYRERLRHEAQEAVDRSLAELPLDFRLPLVLKEIAGLSLAEVAAVLGIPEATAKTRVHRARLRLRRALAERLPRRDAPHPSHPREVCLALLRAKQEALDRGVELPVPPEELCERCEALFATLDLAAETCRRLGAGEIPEEVAVLLRRSAGGGGRSG